MKVQTLLDICVTNKIKTSPSAILISTADASDQWTVVFPPLF